MSQIDTAKVKWKYFELDENSKIVSSTKKPLGKNPLAITSVDLDRFEDFSPTILSLKFQVIPSQISQTTDYENMSAKSAASREVI